MAVTTSSGNGYAVYNGVKLPSIDSLWTDKATYPYAFIVFQSLNAAVSMYSVRFASTEYGYNGSRFYPINDGSYVEYTTPANQATVDWVNANGGNVSLGVWRESGSGSLVSNRAIQLDMRWSSYDIDGFGDGSTPISLDGMTVIEWDGVTDSNSIEIQTGYSIQRIGDYLPADSYGVFVNSNTAAASNPITMYGSPSGSYSSIPDTYTAETSIINNDSWLVSYIGEELDYSVNALLSVKDSVPMSASVTVSEGLWVPVVGLNGTIAMHTPLVAYKTAEAPPEGEEPVITETSGDGWALYNGVKLPKLPEWDKETYPYVAIGNAEREDMPYILITSTVPFVIQNERLTVPLGNAAELYAQMTALNTKWIFAQKLTNNSSSIGYAPVAKSKTVWCNYNIIDEDNSVFLAASDPIPLDGYTVIEWDGNTEGLSYVSLETPLYCVSSEYIESNKYIAVTAHVDPFRDAPYETTTEATAPIDVYAGVVLFGGDAVASVPSDGYTVDGITFPNKGTYMAKVEFGDAFTKYISLFAYKADSGGGGGGTEPNPPDSGSNEGGSGHYGMVEGAIHEIIGGTARVNGADCEIADGRARTGGAWYELNFGGTQSGEGGDIGGDDTELTTGVLFEGGSLAAPIQYQVVNATNAAIGISPSAGIEDDYIFTNCGEGQINAMYPPIPIVAQIGPVDLSGYSTLHMTVSANGHVNFGYGNTLATKNSPNLTDYVTGTNVSINTKVELTVDIGSVSGEQYIKFYAEGTNTTARAYKIWLT